MTKEELSNLIDGLDRDVFRIVSELSEAVSDTAWVAETAARNRFLAQNADL